MERNQSTFDPKWSKRWNATGHNFWKYYHFYTFAKSNSWQLLNVPCLVKIILRCVFGNSFAQTSFWTSRFCMDSDLQLFPKIVSLIFYRFSVHFVIQPSSLRQPKPSLLIPANFILGVVFEGWCAEPVFLQEFRFGVISPNYTVCSHDKILKMLVGFHNLRHPTKKMLQFWSYRMW